MLCSWCFGAAVDQDVKHVVYLSGGLSSLVCMAKCPWARYQTFKGCPISVWICVYDFLISRWTLCRGVTCWMLLWLGECWLLLLRTLGSCTTRKALQKYRWLSIRFITFQWKESRYHFVNLCSSLFWLTTSLNTWKTKFTFMSALAVLSLNGKWTAFIKVFSSFWLLQVLYN